MATDKSKMTTGVVDIHRPGRSYVFFAKNGGARCKVMTLNAASTVNLVKQGLATHYGDKHAERRVRVAGLNAVRGEILRGAVGLIEAFGVPAEVVASEPISSKIGTPSSTSVGRSWTKVGAYLNDAIETTNRRIASEE